MASTRCRELTRPALVITTAVLTLFCVCAQYCARAERDAPVNPQGTEERTPVDEVEHTEELLRVMDDGDVTTYETSTELPATASDLVCEYRDERDCVVRSAGYLDLQGNAWSCLMEGPGWVDLCLVIQQDEGCVVRVARMEVTDWEESDGH